MIEAEFGFFQMEGKGALADAMELGEAVLGVAPKAETRYRNAVLIRRRLLYMVDDDCVHGPSGRHKFQAELFCERCESDCATRGATNPVLRDFLPVHRWIRYPHRADTTFPPRGSPGEHRCRWHTCLRSGSSSWLWRRPQSEDRSIDPANPHR